jgi:hypothetical protein
MSDAGRLRDGRAVGGRRPKASKGGNRDGGGQDRADVVVLLSGEPQGGIKFRQRGPGAVLRDRPPY